MRVVLTGASGFVGSALYRAVQAAGHEVVAFGRRPASALTVPMPGYRQWDIETGPMALPSVDAVVHCAAAVGQWGDYETFWRANVRGTQHVMDSVGPDTRFVFISSASVYRPAPGVALREDAPLVTDQGTAYAITKAASDRLVLARGPRAVSLRPRLVYGPGDTTLWPRVARAVRRGVLYVPGDGRARISTTHVDNLAQATVLALDPRAAGGAYNITDAEPTTTDTLLRTMFARHRRDADIRYLPTALAYGAAVAAEAFWTFTRRSGDPPLTRYAVRALADGCVLDAGRAKRELGYVPVWSVENGPLGDA